HTRSKRDWSSDVCSSDLDANCELKLILDEKAFTSCKTDATLQRARELANLLLVFAQDAPQVSPAFVAEMKEVLTNLEAIPTNPRSEERRVGNERIAEMSQ